MHNRLHVLPNTTKAITDLLAQEPIQSLNLMGILENTPPQGLKILVDKPHAPTGVLLVKGYFHYIFTRSTAFLDLLLEDYFKADFYGFSGLSSFVADYLIPHFSLQWESPCHLYYLPSGALASQLKTRKTANIPISYAEEIDSFYTYKDNYSLHKIREALETLPSSGYFEGDTLCSWVLVHDDNSLGIMYTKEAYRGMGLAVDVSIDLCQKELARGKQPYLQINTQNTMSPGLALKCGFVSYPQRLGDQPLPVNAYWFGGYRGVPDAFKGLGQALGVTVDTLLPLFGLKASCPELSFVSLGDAEPLPQVPDYADSSNTRHQLGVKQGDVDLGVVELIASDNYWFYVAAMAVKVPEAECLAALACHLQAKGAESLMFSGISLPEVFKTKAL